MNILYLIGNGFDLAQGLKTNYIDFYNYLQTLSPRSELEKRVIADIGSDYETWANLEQALGSYTNKWKDPYDFISVVSFLKNHLNIYLKGQMDLLSSMNLSSVKLINDLCFPEKYLFAKGQYVFNSSFSMSKTNRTIHCVTFNYTNTLETVLSLASKSTSVIMDKDGYTISLKEIMHIHGSLNNLLLLGVNDFEQIVNSSFHGNQSLIDEFVKPETNNACMNNKNEVLEEWINRADLIVLFGVSLGNTDNKWWHMIGNRLNSEKYFRPFLFYFPFDSSKDTNKFEIKRRSWNEDYLALIQERMMLETSVEEIGRNVFVGINSGIFNLKESDSHRIEDTISSQI